MSSQFESLMDRTLKFAQGLCGDILGGAVERARRALVKNAVSLAFGMAGVVIALVFGAIGFNRWLETIVDAGHLWVPPVIVALVSGVIGIAALRSARGGGQS